MGLKKKELGQGYLFLKINSKEGCVQFQEHDSRGEVLRDSTGKALVRKERPGSCTIEGIPLKIEIKENEYDGQLSRYIRLHMLDIEADAPKMMVDFPYDSEASGPSFFALQMLGKLNMADTELAISLTPWFMRKGTKSAGFKPLEKDKAGCTVEQEDIKLDAQYGTPDNKLPELQEVKIGGKRVKDKTEWALILENLYNIVAAKINGNSGDEQDEPQSETKPTPKKKTADSDDIPF